MKIYLEPPEEKPIERTEDMIEREAVRKTLKGERKKLASMTGPERRAYIYTYYRLHIICAAAAVILIGYVIYIFATRQETVLMGVVIGDGLTDSTSVAQTIGSAIGTGPREKVDIQDGIYLKPGYSTGVNTGNMSGATQILMYISTKELDFYVCTEEGLEYMEQNKVSKDLREYLPADLVTALSDSFTQDGHAVDISPWREKLGLHPDTMYLGICALSGNDENVIKFVRWLIAGQ